MLLVPHEGPMLPADCLKCSFYAIDWTQSHLLMLDLGLTYMATLKMGAGAAL